MPVSWGKILGSNTYSKWFWGSYAVKLYFFLIHKKGKKKWTTTLWKMRHADQVVGLDTGHGNRAREAGNEPLVFGAVGD